MSSYYYLISSLPALYARDELPFSYDTFLEMCRSNVSGTVFDRLQTLDVSSDKGPLLKEWGQFYRVLMQELNYGRSQRLGKKYREPDARDPELVATVRDALNAKNPLEAEHILMECEFKKLDSLVSMHYFDDWVLFGYAVKLKLLERKKVFVKDEGKTEFLRLFENLQQQIQAM